MSRARIWDKSCSTYLLLCASTYPGKNFTALFYQWHRQYSSTFYSRPMWLQNCSFLTNQGPGFKPYLEILDFQRVKSTIGAKNWQKMKSIIQFFAQYFSSFSNKFWSFWNRKSSVFDRKCLTKVGQTKLRSLLTKTPEGGGGRGVEIPNDKERFSGRRHPATKKDWQNKMVNFGRQKSPESEGRGFDPRPGADIIKISVKV